MSVMIRKPRVIQKVGMSDSNIYRLEQLGQFPTRRKLTPNGRGVGWLEHEIDAWVESRTQAAPVTGTALRIGSGKPGPGRPSKSKQA